MIETFLKVFLGGGTLFFLVAIWYTRRPRPPAKLSFKERAAKRATERLNKTQRL